LRKREGLAYLKSQLRVGSFKFCARRNDAFALRRNDARFEDLCVEHSGEGGFFSFEIRLVLSKWLAMPFSDGFDFLLLVLGQAEPNDDRCVAPPRVVRP
jgi:hypothetical protein